ncbi:hypothetical protein JVU11DRAFT_2283 [Chiua virens]|nr:hypothetical protein JVU11DRAFT_2283 [Chiua virens]
MHPALQLDEILFNIFSRCDPPLGLIKQYNTRRCSEKTFSGVVGLVALARTCTFKEPALDVLWSELLDLTPLARCLPQVCYRTTRGHNAGSTLTGHASQRSHVSTPEWYSFHRPLEQHEWDTLRSYTRRVRSIRDFKGALDADCVRTFLNPPNSEPLFPRLRYLRFVSLFSTYSNDTTPLLYQPFPSLISVEFLNSFSSLSVLQTFLGSSPRDSPNIERLSVRVSRDGNDAVDRVVSDYICRWSNPRIVLCDHITLNIDAITHLSCTPNLTQLKFTLGEIILPDRITTLQELCFDRLQTLHVYCASLSLVSKLLGRIRLPVITDFVVEFKINPSKQQLASIFTYLQSSVSDSITKFCLVQRRFPSRLDVADASGLVLVYDDLRPTMAFRNLRHFELNLQWNVGLTGDDLLGLTAAWPCLEGLLINREWGWRRDLNGVTPEGMVRLLQTCPSLSQLALAIDTRSCDNGCLKAPPSSSCSHPTRRSNPTHSFSIDFLDSVITPAAVPAMAAFLADTVPSDLLSFTARNRCYVGFNGFSAIVRRREHITMWREVLTQANEAIERRCCQSLD